MDDPLRLAVQNGKLFARIEAGGNFGTPGVPIEIGRWHRVCAVKRGESLSLFLDGQPAGTVALAAPGPDGRHLAFSSNRTGKSQIFTMLADGTEVRQLTTQGNNYMPVWVK